MSDDVVVVERLTKTFRSGLRRRSVTAVRELDLRLRRGAVVAFVGPNGAGKTTTIFHMLGLLKPTSGRVTLFGEPPTAVSARRRLGFMSEIFRTYPHQTARSTLAFHGRLAGIHDTGLPQRIAAMLDTVGLAQAADRRVGTFSKGMTQRLGLAQALLHDPELLLLDEPTTGLDPEGRHLVGEIIRARKARGVTVFLSSHILSDVERTCDEVVIVRSGQAVFAGSIADLRSTSDDCEVEVGGVTVELVEDLQRAGFTLGDAAGGAVTVVSPAARKRELLQLFLDRGADVRALRPRSLSLEEVYLKHARDAAHA